MRRRGRRKGCEMGQVQRRYMSEHRYERTEVRVNGRAVSHNKRMKGVVVRSSEVKKWH